MGDEERFPPTRLSAGRGIRKETIAESAATGEVRRFWRLCGTAMT